MKDSNRALLRQLVAEEIRRIVADAIESRGCLEAGRCADLIHRAYPDCGLSAEDIHQEILEAAVGARIPVEIGRTEATAPGTTA